MRNINELLPAPAQPVVFVAAPVASAASLCGGIPAGSWDVAIAFGNNNGEGPLSPPQSVQTTGESSAIETRSPNPPVGCATVIYWSTYMRMAGDSYFSLQSSGIPLGVSYTRTTMPVSCREHWTLEKYGRTR